MKKVLLFVFLIGFNYQAFAGYLCVKNSGAYAANVATSPDVNGYDSDQAKIYNNSGRYYCMGDPKRAFNAQVKHYIFFKSTKNTCSSIYVPGNKMIKIRLKGTTLIGYGCDIESTQQANWDTITDCSNCSFFNESFGEDRVGTAGWCYRYKDSARVIRNVNCKDVFNEAVR